MHYDRTTSIWASLIFGILGAGIAYDTPDESVRHLGRTTRGFAMIIDGLVDMLGQTGAAVFFILLGVAGAGFSAMVCPPTRR